VRRRPGLGDAAFARLRDEVVAASPEGNLRKAQSLRERLFRQQLALLDDPFRYRTVLCPRRAGKSFAAQVLLIDRCLRQPGASVIYITLTRGTAKRIMWSGLKRIDTELELGTTFNNTELSMRFPNGSVLQLGGSETQADVDKFRGVAFDAIIIDECKSFPPELMKELVDEVLTPCLSDRLGTLIMMGTPGAILSGPFYDATGPESNLVKNAADARMHDERDGGKYVTGRPYADRDSASWTGVEILWSQHSWTVADNTAMPHLWDTILAEKRRRGWSDDHPIWLREYMGQWLPDDGAMVYKYDEQRNGWSPAGGSSCIAHPDELPEGHTWKFIMGMDLGFDDDFALQVAAYSETCDEFYHVYDYAEPELTIPAIAAKMKDVIEIFGEFEIMIGDRGGLGKTILATLDEQYGLHVEPAEKQEKRDHIELLNADLISGKCKILSGSGLAQEMLFLQWDETGRNEDKSCANHRCFVAGTMVRTADGEKPIETIRVGERVWTRNGLRRVIASAPSGTRSIWRLDAEDGRSLLGTDDHPIWTDNGWKPLRELTKGDVLSAWQEPPGLVPCRVLRVEPTGREETVYNLTVEQDHEYFANGLLVSNCDAFVYLWRHAFHHFSRKKIVAPTFGTNEWEKRFDEEQIARILERRKREQERDWLDDIRLDEADTTIDWRSYLDA
jgi:hypothetical protein